MRESLWKHYVRGGFSGRYLLWIGEGLLGIGCIGLVFYNAVWAGLFFGWLVPVYLRLRKKGYAEKKRQKLLMEFKDGMSVVAVALSAGYSVENAFIEAEREVLTLYGESADIVSFFRRIHAQIAVNRNIEEILMNFAMESGVEDILCFAEVFRYAKRSGGDMVEIIKDTVAVIGQKADTAREISVLISAKQTEQLIMDIVPIGIILYLRMASPELIGRMYGNPTGIFVMTASLIVYGIAVLISLKIADIRV